MTLRLLREARARITDPAAYTKDGPGRTALGAFVIASDPRAVCWDAVGVLFVDLSTHALDRARAQIQLEHDLPEGFGSLKVWQERPETTHARVLELFDRTIARVQAAKAAAEGG